MSSTNNNNRVNQKTLRFEDGSVQFRQRLVVSILSHRPLLIQNIRSDDIDNPGLQDYEANFLKLIDRMTNGSNIEINATGTQLRFKPGVLIGGDIDHSCPVPEEEEGTSTKKRMVSVGWYLEGILPLAPFGKEPLHITIHGITDGTSDVDPSPDFLATSVIPLFSHFGIGASSSDTFSDQFDPIIKVTKRGAAPLGGGTVRFSCPIIKEIANSIDVTDPGLIKRVRGTVVSCRIPPTNAARTAHAAKGVLHRLLPDVWIHTDSHSSSSKNIHVSGCGSSPGLSMCLTAESTTGMTLSAETSFDPSKHARGAMLPEDLGVKGAAMLLDEIRKGGCIDTGAQSTMLLLMCLGPEDVSRIRIGTLSQYTIVSLRLFKKAFDVEFKVKTDQESRTILLSCLGTGYRNMAKAST